MPQSENRFLTSRTAPDGPKAPVDPDYPAWRYHTDGRSRMVKTIMEDEALGDGWGRQYVVIDDQPAKDAAAVLEGPQAAFYRTIARLTDENEKLTAENMRLKNLVEDSDKVKELVDLRSKFDIAERARKSLQLRVDQFEAAKALAKKAAKENKAALVEGTELAEIPTLELAAQAATPGPAPTNMWTEREAWIHGLEDLCRTEASIRRNMPDMVTCDICGHTRRVAKQQRFMDDPVPGVDPGCPRCAEKTNAKIPGSEVESRIS